MPGHHTADSQKNIQNDQLRGCERLLRHPSSQKSVDCKNHDHAEDDVVEKGYDRRKALAGVVARCPPVREKPKRVEDNQRNGKHDHACSDTCWACLSLFVFFGLQVSTHWKSGPPILRLCCIYSSRPRCPLAGSYPEHPRPGAG